MSMEDYPTAFIVVMAVLFSLQTVTGVSFNLYILVTWCADRHRNKLAKGNHFVTMLKVLDLVIAMSAVPLMVAVLVLERDENLIVCFLKEGAVMFASTASSMSVLMISVDRYTAVVLPTTTTFTRCRVLLCRCVVIAAAITGFMLPSLSLLMGKFDKGKSMSVFILPCRNVLWTFQPYYLYDLYDVILFLITVVVVIMCYRAVLKVARTRTRTMNSILKRTKSRHENLNPTTATIDAGEKTRRQDSKATKMTSAIVASFLICWGPHVTISIVEFALPHSVTVAMIQYTVLFFAFMTPIIHPLIYTHATRGWRKSNRVRNMPLAMGLPGIRLILNRPENSLHLDNAAQQSSSDVVSNRKS